MMGKWWIYGFTENVGISDWMLLNSQDDEAEMGDVERIFLEFQ